jgi:hypothetical protein
MRNLDCPCGLTLTAEDDEGLFVAGRTTTVVDR